MTIRVLGLALLMLLPHLGLGQDDVATAEVVDTYRVVEPTRVEEPAEAARVAAEVLERRIERLKIDGEAQVVLEADGFLVETRLRGLGDEALADVRAALTRPGSMEFRVVAHDGLQIDLERERARLDAVIARGGDLTRKDLAQLTSGLTTDSGIKFTWAPIAEPYREDFALSVLGRQPNEREWVLICHEPDGDFDERHLADLSITADHVGAPALSMKLKPDAAKRMKRYSARNIDRQIAILMDGEVRMAPRVMAAFGADVVVSGGANAFSEAELNRFIDAAKSGALPGTLELVSTR